MNALIISSSSGRLLSLLPPNMAASTWSNSWLQSVRRIPTEHSRFWVGHMVHGALTCFVALYSVVQWKNIQDGATVLHVAARDGHLDVIEYLVTKFHADPHQQDKVSSWSYGPRDVGVFFSVALNCFNGKPCRTVRLSSSMPPYKAVSTSSSTWWQSIRRIPTAQARFRTGHMVHGVQVWIGYMRECTTALSLGVKCLDIVCVRRQHVVTNADVIFIKPERMLILELAPQSKTNHAFWTVKLTVTMMCVHVFFSLWQNGEPSSTGWLPPSLPPQMATSTSLNTWWRSTRRIPTDHSRCRLGHMVHGMPVWIEYICECTRALPLGIECLDIVCVRRQHVVVNPEVICKSWPYYSWNPLPSLKLIVKSTTLWTHALFYDCHMVNYQGRDDFLAHCRGRRLPRCR